VLAYNGSRLALPWDRPEEYDHLVLVVDDDPLHLASIREKLEAIPGRARTASLGGTYPRFRVVTAVDGVQAERRATSQVTAAAVDLVLPRQSGIQLIQALRRKRPDLAIFAFTAAAPPSEAVAAMMAGADHFMEYQGADYFVQALELAIDRRRLARLIEHNEAEVDAARERLSRLGGSLVALPGLRPPHSVDAVLPFHEAARRYLAASAKLFVGDPRGLAERLGVSYFALRRLLKRYGVPFPRTVRGGASLKR